MMAHRTTKVGKLCMLPIQAVFLPDFLPLPMQVNLLGIVLGESKKEVDKLLFFAII